mgnify:CR=1 FL=1
MRDRESKKRALLELIEKDPEAVVELLLDLMEQVEDLKQKLAKKLKIPVLVQFPIFLCNFTEPHGTRKKYQYRKFYQKINK